MCVLEYEFLSFENLITKRKKYYFLVVPKTIVMQ